MVLSPDLGGTKRPGPCASSSPGMQLGPGRDQSGMQVGSEANAMCTAGLSCTDGSWAHKAWLTCPRVSSFDIPAQPWESCASPSCLAPTALLWPLRWRWAERGKSKSKPSSTWPLFPGAGISLSITLHLRKSEKTGGGRKKVAAEPPAYP